MNDAWTLGEQILGELLSRVNGGLNSIQSSVLHEPLASEAIDFNQGVVPSLVESKDVWKVLLGVSESFGNDASVALKLVS